LRDDDADALVARAPPDAVSRDPRRRVGAQGAAEHLGGLLPLLCRDFALDSATGGPRTGRLRPQVTPFAPSEPRRLAPPRAACTLFLDFLDAPALPAVELAFGHLRGMPRAERTRV